MVPKFFGRILAVLRDECKEAEKVLSVQPWASKPNSAPSVPNLVNSNGTENDLAPKLKKLCAQVNENSRFAAGSRWSIGGLPVVPT
jgi:hypothetical protein